MAWEGSDRRERLPDNWATLRLERLKKDNYRCTWILPSRKRCPRTATDVDHRIEGADDDRIEALQSLCSHHHQTKTAKAAVRIKREKRQRRWRPQENHPGAI